MRIPVYVDRELSDWLEGKAMQGYRKGGFIRHLLAERMRKEADGNAG